MNGKGRRGYWGRLAATKLLVPMILMLLVVMAVIMIPACLAFYGN